MHIVPNLRAMPLRIFSARLSTLHYASRLISHWRLCLPTQLRHCLQAAEDMPLQEVAVPEAVLRVLRWRHVLQQLRLQQLSKHAGVRCCGDGQAQRNHAAQPGGMPCCLPAPVPQIGLWATSLSLLQIRGEMYEQP